MDGYGYDSPKLCAAWGAFCVARWLLGRAAGMIGRERPLGVILADLTRGLGPLRSSSLRRPARAVDVSGSVERAA